MCFIDKTWTKLKVSIIFNQSQFSLQWNVIKVQIPAKIIQCHFNLQTCSKWFSSKFSNFIPEYFFITKFFNRNLLILLLLSSSSLAQETSRCTFSLLFGVYSCRLDSMNVATENDFVNLNGNHMAPRTDADVMRVTFNHGRMTTAFPVMIFDRFPNLDTVFITGNLNVERFSIQRCQRLRILSFEGPANAITRLQSNVFNNCVNLQEFLMQRTSVTALDVNFFAGAPNLRRIAIPRNQIQNLPFGIFNGLTRLEQLDIERNQIATFDARIFQGLTALRTIQCGQLLNRLWPGSLFSNLPSLVEIDINWSGLQTILPGAFRNLPSLEVIRIYGEVRRLSANVFADVLPRLHTLNINRNQIEAVERGFFNNIPAVRTVTATFNICINQDLENTGSLQPILSAFENCFSRF